MKAKGHIPDRGGGIQMYVSGKEPGYRSSQPGVYSPQQYHKIITGEGVVADLNLFVFVFSCLF